MDSEWLEEDWDNEIEEEKRQEKQIKEEPKKTLGCYPPELIYYPSHKKEIPVLVADLVPAQLPGENKRLSQKINEKEERLENRRIVEGINNDKDLDYYSDRDSICQSYV